MVLAIRRSKLSSLVFAVAAALTAVGLMAPPAAAAPSDARSAGTDEAQSRLQAAGTGLRPASASVHAAEEPTARDLDAACPGGRVPSSSFRDIGPPFERAIECLVWHDVTRGRTDTSYGTGDRVTRGQMTLFLYRLLRYNLREDVLPGEGGGHGFPDVQTTGELGRALNALSSDELADFLDLDAPLVRGFGDGTYRPGSGVERAQMSSFIARTFDGLLTAYDGVVTQGGFCTFTDSAAIPEPHRGNVSTVCALGIAEGRADGSFAPRNTVTRGQMAAFLMRMQDIFADEPFYGLLPDQDVEIVDRDACDAANADGTDEAPWCTIREGVNAASSPTSRVLVVGSEDPYTENVDLGDDGIEVVGVPVAGGDRLLFPIIDGYADAWGGDLLLGRLIVVPPSGEGGIAVNEADDVRLTSMLIDSDIGGVFVDADHVRIDAVRVQGAPMVGLWLYVGGGDVLGSEFVGTTDAHIVDERGSLDLRPMLERTGVGVRNSFAPAGRIVDDFDGEFDAIVPVS